MRALPPFLTAVLGAALLFGCSGKVAGGEADGSRIFAEVCSRCHGIGGEPSPSMVARYGVKNLRSRRVQEEMSDARIRAQILEGSANKQMPSFEGALTDEQIEAVIAHVRSLDEEPGAPRP
jgi:mono/diheme cytochrome c family protein